MGQKNRNGNLWNRVDIEKVPGDERVGTGLLNLIIYQSDIATQIKKRKIKIAFSLHKRKELLVHFKIISPCWKCMKVNCRAGVMRMLWKWFNCLSNCYLFVLSSSSSGFKPKIVFVSNLPRKNCQSDLG